MLPLTGGLIMVMVLLEKQALVVDSALNDVIIGVISVPINSQQ